MAFSVIQSGQTPGEILRLLATNSTLANQVRQFFAPRCDCDATTWLIARIVAGDQTVIVPIREMIAATPVPPPPALSSSILSANGDGLFLQRIWIEGTASKGEFIDNAGVVTTVVIESNDAAGGVLMEGI